MAIEHNRVAERFGTGVLGRGQDVMRTGTEYREALRDGRRVWVMGEGLIDDVTTHPATRAMVDQYVAWYDHQFDSTWTAIVLDSEQKPLAFRLPRSADDLVQMGRCFSATTFLSAGNITHTPAYGHLISLGILSAVQARAVSPKQIKDATAYREQIAQTQRFLTFSGGGATIGYRLRPDPAERAAFRIVKETDAGLAISGKIGMHTSPAYAEEVFIGGQTGIEYGNHRATFVVPVGAPGVTTMCRKTSLRDPNPFVSPLSSRFDELDGQMWLDNVFIPWERVFLLDVSPEPIARWLLWHQLYCWLSKAETTLGLALACTHAMGLMKHEQTLEYLIDLIIDVQTVRSCLTAAERDPQFTPEGYCYPSHLHLAAGSVAILRTRQRMSELLRIIPGSSLVVAPTDRDLAAPEVADGLEESFGGGGYTALQRAALLQAAWDHVSSALDARESAFELHANGGMPIWRSRIRIAFDRYNELANAVLRQLPVPMPEIDVGSIGDITIGPRRPVTPSA
jgi:aromatic ring hydroxylase